VVGRPSLLALVPRAFARVFAKDMRGLFWRATGLTLALFVALFIGMEWLIAALPALGFEWVN